MAALGIGIIGYGEFAEFSRESWSGLDDVKVVAASDVNRERVPQDLRFYADWREMLADDAVDIVAIATPPSTHAGMALESVKSGKHVFVEKPPAMSIADLDALLAAGQEHRRVVAVDYMLRYNPVVESLKALCDEKVLGAMQHVSVSNYAYDGKLGPDHWFWDKSLSGGILVEHAVHFFDMVSYVWGVRPVRLSAHGVSRKPGMEDKVVACVEYEDGLVGTHFHHFFRPWWFERQSFRFGFDLGEIDVEGWIPLTASIRALVDDARKARLLELFPSLQPAESEIDVREVVCGGTTFAVDRMIMTSVALTKPKMDVYADCLRSAMADVANAVRTGGSPRIGLQNCADSVRIACNAAAFADGRRSMEI